MTNPISLKCRFPDGEYFNIEICKEDKVATLKKRLKSTAEVSEYFNATPVTSLNQVNLLIKPKE
ncbi:4893_t:CDS:2 [Entrophospora sp. SA101]|nr:4893_t:CDS:2 [Entrophospora sp. SA101]